MSDAGRRFFGPKGHFNASGVPQHRRKAATRGMLPHEARANGAVELHEMKERFPEAFRPGPPPPRLKPAPKPGGKGKILSRRKRWDY